MNQNFHPGIVIVGAGLSGLTIAYLLQKSGYPSTILEARNRLGGRIHTLRKNGEARLSLELRGLEISMVILLN